MRNPGLVAFAVTVGVLAPVIALQLSAGPKEREMLFAPGADSLEVGGSHIGATLDRRVVDPGETIHLELTADQRVAVGIVVFGTSGTEGERVPSPPIGVFHTTVTVDGHQSVAIKLRGAVASYEPLATYTIYILSPKAADRLAAMQHRAGPPHWTKDGGPIPDMDGDTSKLFGLMSSLGGEADRFDKKGDEKLFGHGAVARLEAYARPTNPVIAIDAPATAAMSRPFVVGITLKNPTKHAQKVTVGLAFPRISDAYLGIPDEAAKAEQSDTEYTLAKGETRRVELHVTATKAGAIGIQAQASCVDGGECSSIYRTGAFEAVQILDEKQPTVAAKR